MTEKEFEKTTRSIMGILEILALEGLAIIIMLAKAL
jgi:hypothetical protein